MRQVQHVGNAREERNAKQAQTQGAPEQGIHMQAGVQGRNAQDEAGCRPVCREAEGEHQREAQRTGTINTGTHMPGMLDSDTTRDQPQVSSQEENDEERVHLRVQLQLHEGLPCRTGRGR